MSVFQVSSRIMQPLDQPSKRLNRGSRRWFAIQWRIMVGGFIIAMLAILLPILGLQPIFFLLLPVFVTIITVSITNALSHRIKRNILLTAFVGLIYFSAITGWELLTHHPGTPENIVIGTTLALAVLVEPVRSWMQTLLEQRFHLRDDTAIKAVEIFSSTLREEIDMDKVRDGLLAVVQQTLQPLSVSIWVSKPAQVDTGGMPARAEWGINNRQRQHEALRKEQPAFVEEGLYKTSPFDITIAADDPLRAFALSHSGSIEVARLQLDSRLLRILRANEVEIALPLISQGELIGMLSLGPRLDGQKYARADRSLLDTLAAQVAPALRVAQLAQEQQMQVRERERIEQELRTAQEIQHTFLPKEVPALPGWQLAPYYQSAREVGGDFYDFLPFADGRLGIVIGDVTDKGVPAALVMTATRTMLRTAAQEKASPAEVLARVNDLLYADIPSNMFVTCFYLLLDPKSGHMRFANAGHEPPFRQTAGSATELWATGMPLGMMPGTCYEEYEATLEPGESLIFYSDGLVEAHNDRREMFGFARLKSLLEEQSDGASLIDTLLDELQRFTGDGWEQEDDVTMVALHRAVIHQASHVLDFQEAETSG